MKRIAICFVMILSIGFLLADTSMDLRKLTEAWNEVHPNSLPHWMTPDEQVMMGSYDRTFTETAPPTTPVRGVAEFEQSNAVLIRWPLGIPYTLIAELSQDIRVITIVASASEQSSATSNYQTHGVNMNNCSFMTAATDSYWTRDFGPWFVFDGNNQLGIVDFKYNRPRPNDDEIPRTFATLNGIPLYGMNLNQTGGNYMTDGYGTTAQTDIAYTENSNNSTNVNQKMHDYMGANNYWVMEDPNNTYINHIDCWGKFLAPDKVLIRSVPTTHAQYSALENTANYFATHNCGYGYPFKVYRVNTPNDQPYTNSLILNDKVLVPLMSSTYDAAALQAYRNALPGYEVVGFTAASGAAWESTDALHCRTHEIIDKNMLFIKHIPVHGTVPCDSAITFAADFIANSTQALYADSLKLCYSVNGGAYNVANFIQTGVEPTHYEVSIMPTAPGATVHYFIHGADMSDHKANVPRMGAMDPFDFQISADTVPPVIVMDPIPNLALTDFPFALHPVVTDNFGVSSVSFKFGINTTHPDQTLALTSMSENMWELLLTSSLFNDGDSVYYQIIAADNSTPANISTSPLASFRVGTVHTNDQLALPGQDVFLGVYPNPVVRTRLSDSNAVSLKYYSETVKPMSLGIYNIKGQLVQQLTVKPGSKGIGTWSWDGRDQRGRKLQSGVYLIRMNQSQVASTHKFIVLP